MNNTTTQHVSPHQSTGFFPVLWYFFALIGVGMALVCAEAASPAVCNPPKVYIKKYPNTHYELFVDSKPYIVKGVCYNPIPIGYNHEYDWMSDPNKPWLIDGKLMQEMGINTIRLYQGNPEHPEALRQVIKDLYEKFGIRTVLGDWLGFWEYPCPFYGDKAFQDKVKQQVLEMVRLYKDEPGILMWIMGNENNFSCFGRVNPWSTDEIDKEPDPQKRNAARAKTYYAFINDIAKEIHKVDPNHPVALGNGELLGLDYAAQVSPDIDVLAIIMYRGKSFGNIFTSVRTTFDRPILLAEFGADAFDAFLNKEDQNMQAFFLESQWRQIYQNLAHAPEGAGNCIGGTMFEWVDEWWKHEESNPDGWKVHDTASNWSNGSYYFDIKVPGNKNMNEEWFGIVGLSDELEGGVTVAPVTEGAENTEPTLVGVNKRTPRKAYYVIREFWKNPQTAKPQSNTKKEK